MNDDIWFDLHLGNIEVGDGGETKYLPVHSRASRLTTTSPVGITSLNPYRKELHRLLDLAIDEIETRIK